MEPQRHSKRPSQEPSLTLSDVTRPGGRMGTRVLSLATFGLALAALYQAACATHPEPLRSQPATVMTASARASAAAAQPSAISVQNAPAAIAATGDASAATGDASTSEAGAQQLNAFAGMDAGPRSDAGSAFAGAEDDPMAGHKSSREDLLALFTIRERTPEQEKRLMASDFLNRMFGIENAAKTNQGNRQIARHTISKKACLKGLEGITLQTDAQRKLCGEPNMVPIAIGGSAPNYCVDIFEFPNRACELPMVWVSPTFAKKTCELQGKRLCSQVEWEVACRADPAGGPDTRYAYGDALNLDVCHTSQLHRQRCDTTSSAKAWQTCATDTEPSGSFPKCRSRMGVFDQHGNVAEIMMRREGDKVMTQLKGSAWFYKAIAREVGGTPTVSQKGMETYPDHCNFDPRWHVEPIDNAWHVNYHLGFRCCKSIP
jgi:formylglycine-generating enzyme